MYKIKNVVKVMYNNKKVKMFEAWEVRSDCEIFAGCFTAPLKTATKNLGAYITE